jgi:hypothetical protein
VCQDEKEGDYRVEEEDDEAEEEGQGKIEPNSSIETKQDRRVLHQQAIQRSSIR